MNVRAAIEKRIHEYLASDDPKLEWTKATVRKHSFLPLYLGWSAALGIRPDGSLVRWDHEDDPELVKLLTDPALQRTALCQGAKKYPELGVLVPQRPPSARDCRACSGAGEFPGNPQLVCECGGLGWIIPGEQKGPSPG